MAEAPLYILTGLSLYAGAHHLYLGGWRTGSYPHLPLGGLYLLLAGFALSSGLTYQAASLGALLPAARLEISVGLVLWAALVWYVAFRCAFKPLILLDLMTSVWAIFLLRNLTEPNSLLYDVTPAQPHQTPEMLYTSVSHWWTAVELTMVVSLVFCAYACYHAWQHGQRAAALLTAAGLGLLGLVTLHDHFVTIQAISTGYLAPLGFLLFLLPASIYPLIESWRRKNTPQAPAAIYNLPHMPTQASFHTDVSQLQTPLRNGGHRPATKPAATELPSASPVIINGLRAEAANRQVAELHLVPIPDPAKKPQPAADGLTLETITDNLIDISVYATMALNRFKRGDADPETLESLCRKIRTHAIKTRRLAHQLTPAGGKQGQDGDATDRD